MLVNFLAKASKMLGRHMNKLFPAFFPYHFDEDHFNVRNVWLYLFRQNFIGKIRSYKCSNRQ